ncbi:hypothetical protein BD626DRAFT_495603 [Schizophyllum amplum]|uniref:Uncharacterized protein n=1 Tax=Schizophyllum amplum TaxID=97359 RepID=A0A550CEA6_9AGAR|nr:hypothetical protein BD626DRAFT_495603 [Auriculariopsis ampla]
MSFHLRPVDTTHSTPSPTASTASPRDDLRAPHMKPPSLPSPPSSSSGPQPRPFSPGALRDVDLGYDGASAESSRRHYPPPPTGHDLMAMFPAKRPECKPPAASSDIFARQERAFFAQAGREIRRLDAPEAAAPRGWPGHNQPLQPAPHPMTPVQNGGGSYPYPPPGARPVPMPPPPGPPMHTQPYPPPMPQEPVPHPHAHPSHHRHPSSGPMPMRSPPREPPAPAPVQHADIVLEDPDESWRRPVPCSERRRAGKHTKRVVVKH